MKNKEQFTKKQLVNKIKEEIRKYLQTKEDENTAFQNLGDSAKAFLRVKFIAMQALLKKQEKFQITPNLPPKRIRKRRTNKAEIQ